MYYSEYSIFISWQRIRIFIPDIPLAGWRLSSMAGRVVMWLNLIMWLLLLTIITLLILQYTGSAAWAWLGSWGLHRVTQSRLGCGQNKYLIPNHSFWALFIIIRSVHNPLTNPLLQCIYFSVTTLYRHLKWRSPRPCDMMTGHWQPEQSLFFFLSIPCLGNQRKENVEFCFGKSLLTEKKYI